MPPPVSCKIAVPPRGRHHDRRAKTGQSDKAIRNVGQAFSKIDGRRIFEKRPDDLPANWQAVPGLANGCNGGGTTGQAGRNDVNSSWFCHRKNFPVFPRGLRQTLIMFERGDNGGWQQEGIVTRKILVPLPARFDPGAALPFLL
jgi:hypothetical protein